MRRSRDHAGWLEDIVRDAIYATRILVGQPGFTLTAALTLALAIGVNTSLFTVFNALVLRPWPVPEPGKMVTVFETPRAERANVQSFSLAAYSYMRDQARSLDQCIAWRPVELKFGPETTPTAGRGSAVSGNYFQAMGVAMQRGRALEPSDDRPDARAVAVLSDTAWRARFASDASVLNSEVRLNGVPFTVIGIAPPEFTGTLPEGTDFWLPASSLPLVADALTAQFLQNPTANGWSVGGRLAAGRSREQARAELELINAAFRSSARLEPTAVLVAGTSLLEQPGARKEFLPVFALMFSAVLLVLLLACANVGNLLLARAAARQSEISMRLALGARPARVVRQLITESLVLALIGGAAGLLLATWLPRLLMTRLAGQALTISLTPDGTVLVYALGLCVAACLVFGLAPALHAVRDSIAGAIRTRGQSASRSWLRSSLLAVQVAASVILLVCAGLLLRGVQQGGSRPLGFEVEHVAVTSIDLPPGAYDRQRRRALAHQIASEIEQRPEMRLSGITSLAPFGAGRLSTSFRRPGSSEVHMVSLQEVSGGYFAALGIGPIRGRTFTTADFNRKVALVNESMARRYWPGQDAVGQMLETSEPYEIIGVVRDASVRDPGEFEPILYLPFSGVWGLHIVSRTDSIAATALASLVAGLEPRARTRTVPVSANLDRALQSSRLVASLAGGLGLLALAVSTVGMFGVFAYCVRQRTREIGIRMALGGQRPRIILQILLGASRSVAIGLAVGFAGAAVASLALQSGLYGVGPLDPLTYACVAALMLASALGASAWPACAITKVDPVISLRAD